MKLKYTVLLLALAASTGAASAASIYVNFNGSQAGGGAATGSPFGIPAASWTNTGNVATNAVGIIVGTGSTLTWASANTWGDNVAPSTANESVFGGYLDDSAGGSPSMTLTGLTAEFGGSLYNITIYSFSDAPANPTGSFILNGGAPVASTSSASTGALTGNYGVTTFSGVSGNSFTIAGVVSPNTTGRDTISGFSVVAVPEPSGALLPGLAGFALILRRRK